MEVAVISDGVEAIKAADHKIPKKHHRIQVSNTKKPLFFYLNLAKRYMKLYNDVELSALGMAIPTVVTIAEILKSNGLATEKHISTSTVGSKDENKGRQVQKAKIEILLEKTENFEELTLAAVKGRKPTTNTASEAQVTENSTKTTPVPADDAIMAENTAKSSVNTADKAEKTQEMKTNAEVEALVTENLAELSISGKEEGKEEGF